MTAANKAWYKSKRSTTVYQENGVWHCRYHDTNVVSWDEKTITLDNGGWFSYTSKARMNEVSLAYDLKYWVWQKNHNWFVAYEKPPSCDEEAQMRLLARTKLGYDDAECEDERVTVPFHNGMVLQRWR